MARLPIASGPGMLRRPRFFSLSHGVLIVWMVVRREQVVDRV